MTWWCKAITLSCDLGSIFPYNLKLSQWQRKFAKDKSFPSLRLAAHTQLLQVLHEYLQSESSQEADERGVNAQDLQADIVSQDWSSTVTPTHSPGLVVVGLAGIHLGGKI